MYIHLLHLSVVMHQSTDKEMLEIEQGPRQVWHLVARNIQTLLLETQDMLNRCLLRKEKSVNFPNPHTLTDI